MLLVSTNVMQILKVMKHYCITVNKIIIHFEREWLGSSTQEY